MGFEQVGLIGTGIMGVPMGRNLLKAGYSVTVHTRTPTKAEQLLREGATWATSPAELASRCDCILTMVSDSPNVEEIYLGDNGIVTTVREQAVCADMSTIAPQTAQQVDQALRKRNARFLDAPVSGGKTGAETGTLVIMVGGEVSALETIQPVLASLSRSIVHCGPCGYGQLTKLCNQILCGVNLLAVSEAVVFARRVGLDPEVMLKAVKGGAAGSWALENLGPRMVSRDFAPMFMIDLQQKDLRIALEAARTHHVPLPGTGLVHQLLAANQAQDEGREGTQALVKTLERLAAME